MQLTPHFSLEELSFSALAARQGIDNTPTPEIIEQLTRTANGLERVRSLLNSNAIRVTSGYRSPALELVLCGDSYRAWCQRRGFKADFASWNQYLLNKQHPKGQAVDFTSPYGSPEQIVRAIQKSGIDYDQLLLEFPASGGWVHISFSDDNRRQTLVVDQKGTRVFA